MALLAQRHRDCGCLLVLPPQTFNILRRSVVDALCSPALKMRTSADSWQREVDRMQSCCSASSTNGTARSEEQRRGLLAWLATSNFQCILGGPCRPRPAALLRKWERLQIAGRQKGLAWKAIAQSNLPMALLEKKRRDWGCLLLLPPETSNVAYGVLEGCLRPPTCLKCERLQIALSHKGLA